MGRALRRQPLCSTVQKELGIAVSGQCVPRAPGDLCSGIWQAPKPSRLPWRSLGGTLQCQGRTGKGRPWLAVASLGEKGSLKEHGVVICRAGLGWLPAGFTTKPLSWAARQCHSWTEVPLQAGVRFAPVIPWSLLQISEELQQLAGGPCCWWQLCNSNMLLAG